MAKHTDPNGAIWEITQARDSWHATPAPESDTGYINTFDDIEDKRSVGSAEVFLLWPKNLEPGITGKFAEVQPGTAIDAFARQNRAKATIRVTGKGAPGNTGGESSILALVIVGLVLLVLDGKGRK